jgi:hypothetical protein
MLDCRCNLTRLNIRMLGGDSVRISFKISGNIGLFYDNDIQLNAPVYFDRDPSTPFWSLRPVIPK